MMRRRRGGRNYRSKIITAFILLLLCLAVHLIDSQIRPVITEFAGYKIKSIAVESINKAVMDEFVDNGYTYDDLSVINRDENNAVSSIVMNSVLLNRIKAELVQMVQDNIKKSHNTTLEIPIGTLSGIHLLSGKGPDLHIGFTPSVLLDAAFNSEFLDAGINQVLHRVTIRFTVQITAIIPGYITSTTIETEIAVAETVIVGVSPDTFTVVNGDERSIISKIMDYGR